MAIEEIVLKRIGLPEEVANVVVIFVQRNGTPHHWGSYKS